jgi:hypothetical protein
VFSSGFGSFHTEDVEVLVRQRDDIYKSPPVPFELPEYPTEINFGESARHKIFLLDPEWVCVRTRHH